MQFSHFAILILVSYNRSGPTNASQIQLHTAQGSTLTFNTPNPEDLKDLLLFLLAELRRLSRFTVAIQDNVPKGLKKSHVRSVFFLTQIHFTETNLLAYRKGDLVYLEGETTGESLMKNIWGMGRNRRTDERGDVSNENVYILPTLREPPSDIIVRGNYLILTELIV